MLSYRVIAFGHHQNVKHFALTGNMMTSDDVCCHHNIQSINDDDVVVHTYAKHMPLFCMQNTDETNNNSSTGILIRNFQFTFRSFFSSPDDCMLRVSDDMYRTLVCRHTFYPQCDEINFMEKRSSQCKINTHTKRCDIFA